MRSMIAFDVYKLMHIIFISVKPINQSVMAKLSKKCSKLNDGVCERQAGKHSNSGRVHALSMLIVVVFT